LVEHGTLDASFSDRGGKVLCSTINRDAPVAIEGLELGDELLEFEGIPIENANQFTNLICTLPEDWPAHLKIRKQSGVEMDIHVRLFGLPYARPGAGGGQPRPGDEPPSEEERQARELQQAMIELLSAEPGVVRDEQINHQYAARVIGDWVSNCHNLTGGNADEETGKTFLRLTDDVFQGEVKVGTQETWLASDGRFRVLIRRDGENEDDYRFDGETYSRWIDGAQVDLSVPEARLELPVVAAKGMLSVVTHDPYEAFGDILIDGGDKAGGQNAWRLSRSGRDGEQFYFWLRMYGEDGLPAPQLIKACADKDCERRNGGVLFEQWQPVEGASRWLIPMSRAYVLGIDEHPAVRFETTSVETVDEIEDAMFFFGLE
ncbi:MAG: hypothetical protein AAF456_12630, partial [Planctomycetota bacterium]